MNAERFHSLLKALDDDMKATGVRELFAALISALQNQVNNPAEPSYQTAVAEARRNLRQALNNAPSNSFTPSWRQAVEEMEIEGMLGSALAEELEETFTELAATPAAIMEWATEESKRQDRLKSQLDNGLGALRYFEVGEDTLEPGEFELSLLVPRGAVHEHMGELGAEFVKLERIILPFVELATGSRPPLDVKTISSSDFGIILGMLPGAAAAVAYSVDKVMDLYLKFIEIKTARAKLKELEAPDSTLVDLEEWVNTVMSTGIEQAAGELMETAHPSLGAGRRHELEMELKLSMNAIANRIDHGYHIEVRVQPLPAPEADDDEEAEDAGSDAADLIRHIEAVQQRNPKMRFFEPPGTPILALPEPTPPADAADPDAE